MRKLRKRISIIIIASILLALTGFGPVLGETTQRVSINNVVVSTPQNFFMDSDVVMIGALELADALGATFNFDKSSLKGVMKKGNNELIFRLDNPLVQINGKYVDSQSGMIIKGSRIIIPAKLTAEYLNAFTYYDVINSNFMIYEKIDGKISYIVKSGDSLWTISKMFATTISQIKSDNGLVSDTINLGQELKIRVTQVSTSYVASLKSNSNLRSSPSFDGSILSVLPALTEVQVIGKNGDWYQITTTGLTGYVYKTLINIPQDFIDTAPDSVMFTKNIPLDTSMNSVSYSNYTIQKGDTVWALAERFGIPDYELRQCNGFTSSTVLSIGQIIKVPVHNIPVKQLTDPKAGELLDWFSEAQYVFPIMKTGKLTDILTGKSFNVRRTMGANHSDTETLTSLDTQIMKSIFGGSWSWERRTFILETDGRKIAVSISGMPHAGVDGVPFNQNVSKRSGDYGYGPNYDRISGNGMDGHFDLYMMNCLRHVDNKIDSAHQLNVLLAAGLK